MAGLLSAALLACFTRLGAASGSCGEKGSDSTPWSSARIVNGQESTSCEWKWQACLKNPGLRQCWCGGTLISDTWVLTAAHCTQELGFEVMLGDFNHYTTGESGYEQKIAVKRVINHPNYDDNTMEHDYSLIELATPATMNDCVGTACLPTDSMALSGGETCYITGWGTITEGGEQPDNLLEAKVNIVGHTTCNTKYGGGIDSASMLCAQGVKDDGSIVDACQGDSGGPLVCESGGTWYVHGATSWGYGCASAQYPGIWARVTSELAWINGYVETAPTPAVPTLEPTPAPTLDFQGQMFIVLSGECTVDDSHCAQSPNYPSDYAADQSCSIAVNAEKAEPILVLDFDTEADWDIMTINGLDYSGATEPAGIVPTDTITWSSDFMVQAGGWRLCPQFQYQTQPSAPPTPAPPTSVPTPAPPTPAPTPFQCGVPGTDSTPWSSARIVNGQEASACEWSWQVGLKSAGWAESFCGGTLIDKRWVLTAAHCVGGASFNIIAGEFDLASDDDGAEPVVLQVANVIVHEDYNPSTLDKDFALVHLAEDAPLGSCIGTACLPNSTSDLPVGSTCYISGWGTMSAGGNASNTIREAEVTTLSNEACSTMYVGNMSSNYYDDENMSDENMSSDYYYDENATYDPLAGWWDPITDSMLCAQGVLNGGVTDACQGDSGGPLVCSNSEGYFELHGTTSWGYGCGDRDYPGVWARVTSVIDWITETMSNPPPPPTPYPPVAPGEAWTVASGDCVVSGDCLTSPNYPQQYDTDQACVILVATGNTMAIEVSTFQTEDYFDYLTVNGNHFHGGDGPAGVVPSSVITWSADYTISDSGWKLCLVEGSGEAGSCADLVPDGAAEWYDADGEMYTCEWYAATNSCGEDWVQGVALFGMTATQACCTCGGGETSGGHDYYDDNSYDYDCNYYYYYYCDNATTTDADLLGASGTDADTADEISNAARTRAGALLLAGALAASAAA